MKGNSLFSLSVRVRNDISIEARSGVLVGSDSLRGEAGKLPLLGTEST